MGRIVVYGATGFTGRLVVEELSRTPGTELVLGGRDPGKLEALARSVGATFRAAAADDDRGLDVLMSGARVVVATAGPFVRVGEPVVRAALRAGAHYLDSTGEQPFMSRVLERYDALARDRGVAVVPAHGFEYALGWCAATRSVERLVERLSVAPRSSTDPRVALPAPRIPSLSLDVYHRVERFATTRGTQKSALGVAAGEALEVREGRLKPLPRAWWPRRVRVPGGAAGGRAVPIPGGEALHAPRRWRGLERVQTHLVVPGWLGWSMGALWLMRPLLAAGARVGALEAVERRLDRGREGPDATSRARARFQVWAVARGGGAQEVTVLEGSDPYGLTGALLARAAERLAVGRPEETGVLSSDRALGVDWVLGSVADRGVTVREETLS